MNRELLSFSELVVELRKCADNDEEFAQQVALACATIVDRKEFSHRRASDVIRAFFKLD